MAPTLTLSSTPTWRCSTNGQTRGYAHYLYVLSQHPGHRVKVLKEIASSDVARYSGTKLEMDLPDNHLWAKSLNDPQRYLHTSHGLRVAKILSDVQGLRTLIGNLSLGKLSEALRTVVDTQQGHLAALESRLSDNTSLVQALEARLLELGGAAAAPPSPTPTAAPVASATAPGCTPPCIA
ncbi:hypothetical protein [Ideonella paludis]|uniref:hypothetical protein n=1 Tax=Ideonella paludis TaxID=1233411 RepID=UPI0036284FB4